MKEKIRIPIIILKLLIEEEKAIFLNIFRILFIIHSYFCLIELITWKILSLFTFASKKL